MEICCDSCAGFRQTASDALHGVMNRLIAYIHKLSISYHFLESLQPPVESFVDVMCLIVAGMLSVLEVDSRRL